MKYLQYFHFLFGVNASKDKPILRLEDRPTDNSMVTKGIPKRIKNAI